MRKRTSTRRGRPRGKYYSRFYIRLLEYLALISMKYGIDLDDFFDSFVEAWKHQESTCESLSIKCRKRTRDYAVFLITDSFKVVAQFPIPKRILKEFLKETSPLKEFSRASRRTIREEAKVKHLARALRIGDLKSGMNRIDLKARILEIPKPRSVITRFGGFAKVTNASIADETGIIHLPLWNKQIDAVSVGDLIRVENARVVTYRGERQLRVSRGGQLSVVEKS